MNVGQKPGSLEEHDGCLNKDTLTLHLHLAVLDPVTVSSVSVSCYLLSIGNFVVVTCKV